MINALLRQSATNLQEINILAGCRQNGVPKTRCTASNLQQNAVSQTEIIRHQATSCQHQSRIRKRGFARKSCSAFILPSRSNDSPSQ